MPDVKALDVPVLTADHDKDPKAHDWIPTGRLVKSFLAGRNERTSRAYEADLHTFRRFIGARNLEDAARVLLRRRHGESNALALGYRAHMVERGLAPATVNRRLASVRSLVKRARLMGLVPWTLEVPNIKAQAYRDTRGPGRDGFNRMLEVLAARQGRKTKRDVAALRLLFDLALRRHEVVSLDIEDVDLPSRTLLVMGKGRTQKVRLTLPRVTASALTDWIKTRGAQTGPLFVNFDRAKKGLRLTGRSLNRIVHGIGLQAGIRVSPHGLRHAAITEALDLTSGDVRAVQRFSRHRDLRVLNVYDDSREDLAGKVAELVATGDRLLRRSGYRFARRRNGRPSGTHPPTNPSP